MMAFGRAACSDHREDLVAYIDHELEPGSRSALESHLATCEGCSQELERQRQLSEALASLPQLEPSGELTARFWARLAREGESRPRRLADLRTWLTGSRIAVGLGSAAAVAAGVALLVRAPADPDPDWPIIVDAENYELFQEGDLELLDVMEILEVWDGSEDI